MTLRKDFILTLQFYRDDEGTLCLLQTNKDGTLGDDFLSMGLFGTELANSELLDHSDLRGLRSFCNQFIESSIRREALEGEETR